MVLVAVRAGFATVAVKVLTPLFTGHRLLSVTNSKYPRLCTHHSVFFVAMQAVSSLLRIGLIIQLVYVSGNV
jgi:hypothetical protein